VNKKIISFSIFLAIVMMVTPLVSAVPGAPKPNEKFQTWHYTKEVSFGVLLLGEHVYTPSFEEPNKLVISSTEGFLSYEITVNGYTYVQGVDFDCIDVYTEYTAILPVFDDPAQLWPSSSQSVHLLVLTTFDFSAYEGSIEGQLCIMERGNGGNTHTTNLWATGDLQNVQLQATYYNILDPTTVPFPTITVYDDGTVIGWPNMAPL
jgi:hypothetical protein